MEKLPSELIVHIFSFLEPADIITAQSVSRRFLAIARDASLWKTIWWDPAHAPSRHRAEEPAERGPLSFLATRLVSKSLATLSLPGQRTDFYEEYIAAHAPICASWVCESRTDRSFDTGGPEYGHNEAIGLAIYYNDSTRQAEKIFSPMDDGSISVWNMSRDSSAKRGAMLDQTQPGHVGGNPFTRTAAHHVDNATIDSGAKKGYFAIDSTLTEVDLHTLQTISQHEFPFNITTLSEARHPVPITVGTTDTIHLHDVRQSDVFSGSDFSTRCESMDASTRSSICGLDPSPVSRPPVGQYKPLSILHLPLPGAAEVSHSIWVAGRFPSLMHYDRRHFPKLVGNIYSGGNLSSLTYMSHAFVDWDRHAYVEGTDTTIVAAGDYKGKGSLEMYGVSAESGCALPKQPSTINRNSSLFRIMAVASQGARLVASDGHGNLTWWYRDGRTKVRTFNINEPLHVARTTPVDEHVDFAFEQYASDYGEWDAHQREPDMVCKIRSSVAPSSHNDPTPTSTPRGGLNTEDLIVQTDSGRIGLIGFGEANALEPVWHEAAEDAKEMEQRRQERLYGSMMRQALEEHTRELNWMGTLGMAP